MKYVRRLQRVPPPRYCVARPRFNNGMLFRGKGNREIARILQVSFEQLTPLGFVKNWPTFHAEDVSSTTR